jgi:hypothetical protein
MQHLVASKPHIPVTGTPEQWKSHMPPTLSHSTLFLILTSDGASFPLAPKLKKEHCFWHPSVRKLSQKEARMNVR